MVQHHAQATPTSALVSALVGGLALLGCPQLLDDNFGARLPTIGMDSHDPSGPGPDAAVSAAGASGGGGSGNAPDAAGAGGTATASLPDAGPSDDVGALLVHRYRFEGAGGTVVDSVGNADGTTVGAVQSNGQVTLSGSNYVDLPNGIISSLVSVTFEAWVTWSANPALPSSDWQILLSFGRNVNPEGSQGSGTTYLALTPKASNSGHIRASYTLTGYDNEVYADGDDHLPTTAGTQVVLVVDSVLGSLSVYVNGSLADSQAGLRLDLSAIDDINNWIGRSQFSQDPNFVGNVLDFRIYGSALHATQVARSYALGADADL